jgi:hypothetical protein
LSRGLSRLNAVARRAALLKAALAKRLASSALPVATEAMPAASTMISRVCFEIGFEWDQWG